MSKAIVDIEYSFEINPRPTPRLFTQVRLHPKLKTSHLIDNPDIFSCGYPETSEEVKKIYGYITSMLFQRTCNIWLDLLGIGLNGRVENLPALLKLSDIVNDARGIYNIQCIPGYDKEQGQSVLTLQCALTGAILKKNVRVYEIMKDAEFQFKDAQTQGDK